MENILVIGDSYSHAREGDTGLDRGWPSNLEIPDTHRQGLSGSTARQWAANENGILQRAKDTVADTVILSLLGNDAFGVENEIANATQAVEDVMLAYRALVTVLAAIKRPRTVILLYPDPFRGQHQDFNLFLPLLNGAVRSAAAASNPGKTIFVDLGAILDQPGDFNGVDIHPTVSGHARIAAYLTALLA